MGSIPAALLFLVSLAVTLGSARIFARRLDRLGCHFGFPEALTGILTALAADGPEICAALFALGRGAKSVSVGVLVGSNVFNLAAMIGVSLLVGGRILLPRAALAVDTTAGAIVTLLGSALLFEWLSPAYASIATGCTIAAYLMLVIAGSRLLRRRGSCDLIARRAVGALEAPPPAGGAVNPARLIALIAVDVAFIIAGSAGTVAGALTLGNAAGLSRGLLGVLILAPLTSLPNATTAVRLALGDRGAALVAEAFNSNTINLAAGVIFPSLFVTIAAPSSTAELQLAWLLLMTAATIGLLARRRGASRLGGISLIALYLVFVGFTVSGA